MSLQPPSLPIGSICYALFARGDGLFHWALVFPINESIGIKMHVTNATGGWVFEAVQYELIKSQTLCVLVKIGNAPADQLDKIKNMFNAIPMEVPDVFKSTEKTFDCRVWVKEACRVLAVNAIIRCHNVNELERECLAFGNANEPNTIKGCKFLVHTARSSQ